MRNKNLDKALNSALLPDVEEARSLGLNTYLLCSCSFVVTGIIVTLYKPLYSQILLGHQARRVLACCETPGWYISK